MECCKKTKRIYRTRGRKMKHYKNQLNPQSRVLPEKVTGPQILKELPAFYAHLPHSKGPVISPEKDRSSTMPFYTTSLTPILVLSSHLCLGLPSGLLKN
jgi:hypothetical protein